MPDMVYRRHLPHIHLEGYPLFIPFRLADSLPNEVLLKLKVEREQEIKSAKNISQVKPKEVERKHFMRFNALLDSCSSGPHWLKDEKIAGIVSEKILEMNNNRYRLIAYCIMSNHVHMLIEPYTLERVDHKGKSVNYQVTETLRLLKGSTARACNLALGRNGSFWHHESYDHVVRDDNELMQTIHYILNNPVKAGLVKEWKYWKFSHVDPVYGGW